MSRRGDAEKGHGKNAQKRGEQESPAGEVDGFDFLRGKLCREYHCVRRADGATSETIHTFRAFPILIRERIGLCLALNRAQPAIDAFVLVYFEIDNVPPRNEPEHGAQRADVPAPKSFPNHVQKKDTDEYRSDKETLDKDRVDIQVFEKLDQGIADSSQVELVEQSDKGRKTIAYGWQNPDNDGTVQKGERIKNTHQIEGKNSAYQDKHKNVVFPCCVIVTQFFRAVQVCLFKNKRKKLLNRSQGADPSARHTAQEEGNDKGYDSRQKGDKKDTGCDRGRQGQ